MGILSALDVAALTVFFACWAGYSVIVDQIPSIKSRSVIAAMDEHRRRWMLAAMQRDNRISDVSIINNLMSSTSFLANNSIFILAGLVALLSAPELGRRVLSSLPFAQPPGDVGWELRVGLMVLIFVRAFFELTWALRQFNYCSILIGGFGQASASVPQAEAAAMVANRAGRHFNTGLRAYYFGLAALAWILHPAALIVASLWVLKELHRREFRSVVREALTNGQ